MGRVYRDEYMAEKQEALDMAKKYGTSAGIDIYLSLTAYGKRVFQALNREFYNEIMEKFRNGIITGEEKQTCMDAYMIIENGIAEACVY